ncbi:hypothetical protein FUAX_46430 (plasmid) [Fulvitalea axinellae]|uniref:PKD/Chitinase domain-containing protein n=1 Tax=Fulvitalea axinellae TaxID=1182444 RepID=A0AAU9CSX9_9BACT|nr:hypothetical protein FUAX_46430 [Fulvitalea axinellae]
MRKLWLLVFAVILALPISSCKKTTDDITDCLVADFGANFEWEVTGSSVPITVDFRYTSNVSPNIISYTWKFGDGTADGSGEKVTHEYAKAGIYQVTLYVKGKLDNGDECTKSMTKDVTVQPK